MDSYAYLVRRVRKIGPRIDLGCGKNCRPGFVGIDIREQGQDILWDVRDGLPLPDSSVAILYTSHFVEHLTDAEIRSLLVDILRVCAPAAKVEIRCPHCSSIEAYYHGHLSLWSEKRVRGFVAGFHRGAAILGGKYFKLQTLKVSGIELHADLVVEGK